jgi:hypothetical protein
MALIKFNTTLAYGNNILEFWNEDATGNPIPFDLGITLKIRRILPSEQNVTIIQNVTYGSTTVGEGDAAVTVTNSYITLTVNIPTTTKQATDTPYDYDNPVFEHVWSLESPQRTYIYGKLNLIETA